jgi:hypothetical protein
VAMNRDAVVAAVGDVLMPTWSADRDKFDRIDRWARWDHDPPHRPKNATAEYRELAARAQAPWGALIVSSVVQTLYVEGYRRPKAPEDNRAWLIWQANGWDARQIHVHRAALTYGIAYAYALPGKTLSGEPMPKLRGVSPREMIAVYDDPADDDFPQMAMLVRKARKGYRLRVFDERFVHDLVLEDETSVCARSSGTRTGSTSRAVQSARSSRSSRSWAASIRPCSTGSSCSGSRRGSSAPSPGWT